MIVGGAGGPGALQTSPPARKRKSVDTNPHAALAGLTLPGLARQLLNRRSGSARLRSTASQLLLAALRNAKQSSERKAVLSHALAALTALEPVRKPGYRGNSSRDADRAQA